MSLKAKKECKQKMLRLFKGWTIEMLTALSLTCLACSAIILGLVQLRQIHSVSDLEERIDKIERWIIAYEDACKKGQVHTLYFDGP